MVNNKLKKIIRIFLYNFLKSTTYLINLFKKSLRFSKNIYLKIKSNNKEVLEKDKENEFKLHDFKKINIDPIDERDIKFSSRHSMTINLPKSVDLRLLYDNRIENQGDIGSCTGQGGTALMEFINTYLYKNPPVELSALYLYYKERELEGSVNYDNGAVVRSAMKILQKNGVCREELWPYDINKLKIKPSEECDKDAANYRIHGYQRVENLEEIKNALKIKHPVLIGMKLYQSFDTSQTQQTGMIPIPNVRRERYLGSHCMLIVGYDDNINGGSYIVQNSWGPEWADHGFCYVPYACTGLIHDAWTIIENDSSSTGITDNLLSSIRK